ncbi:YSIRK signal domain/LPXTG anchor domain surface protein [Gemella bergeri]|nr:YSIRK signal domain/LPXTG anchor domain surface protein [Gemella bergeri]
MKKQEKFSIRKYKIGAASVLIGLGIAISGREVVAQSTYIPTTKMTPPYNLQDNTVIERLIKETKQKINEDSEKLKQLINTKESLNSEDKKSAKERVEEKVKSATGKIDALNKGEKLEEFKKKITDIKNTFIKDIQKIELGLTLADKIAELKENKNLSKQELEKAIEKAKNKTGEVSEKIDKAGNDNISHHFEKLKEELTRKLSKINPKPLSIQIDKYLVNIEKAKKRVLNAINVNKNLSNADKTLLKTNIERTLQELVNEIRDIAKKANNTTSEEIKKAQKKIEEAHIKALKEVALKEIDLELGNKQEEIDKSNVSEDVKDEASDKLRNKAEEITENINKAENSDELNKIVDQGKKDIANIKVKEDNKKQKPDTPNEPKQPEKPNKPIPPKGSAIPQDGEKSLSADKPQLKVTRWIDENGKELKSTYFDELRAGDIAGYIFDKTSKEDGITTHYFKKIKDNKPDTPNEPKQPEKPNKPIPPKGSAIPQDGEKSLSADKPQLKVTRWVDENGKELKSTKSGKLDAGEIKGYMFDKTLEKDGVTTHHFKKLKETLKNSIQPLSSNKNLIQGKTLPNTGQTSTQNTILELGIISALGLITRKKLSNK